MGAHCRMIGSGGDLDSSRPTVACNNRWVAYSWSTVLSFPTCPRWMSVLRCTLPRSGHRQHEPTLCTCIGGSSSRGGPDATTVFAYFVWALECLDRGRGQTPKTT